MKNKKTKFISTTLSKSFEQWEKDFANKSAINNVPDINYNLNSSNSRYDLHGIDTQELNRIMPNIIRDFLNNINQNEIEIVTGEGTGALATELEDLIWKNYRDQIQCEKSPISASFILRKIK